MGFMFNNFADAFEASIELILGRTYKSPFPDKVAL